MRDPRGTAWSAIPARLTLVTRSRCKTDITVTEVRADDPVPFMTGAPPSEGAFSVILTLRGCRDRLPPAAAVLSNYPISPSLI